MLSAGFGIKHNSTMKTAARWISIVAHPFVTGMVMIAGIAFQIGPTAEAFRILLLVAAVALLPIAALATYKVRRGVWQNIDASNRSERPLLLGAGALVTAALLAFGLVFQPGSALTKGCIGVLVMLVVCVLVLRWVIVSLHMAFAALAAAMLLMSGSPLGWGMVAILPLLAWSRLSLDRHTPPEVIVGFLAGVISALAIQQL